MANPVKISAEITNIVTHDEHVFTVTLKTEKRIPKFLPGQFLHLTIDEYDPQGGFWPDSRVFSIASSPVFSYLEIVYSVKGQYTNRMAKEINIGSKVWVKLPYGDFSIENVITDSQDIVLIAGGTGISPYMSYLHGLKDLRDRKVHLIYGIRYSKHLLYKDILAKCLENNKSFSIDLFLEEMIAQTLIDGANQYNGRINLEHICKYQSLNNPAFFLSGPPTMIKSFKDGLLQNSVDVKNIKIDDWE
jgi:ferredoxin-NADP reductase